MRSAARRADRRSFDDIRASGEIAETANTVIAIYRSESRGRTSFRCWARRKPDPETTAGQARRAGVDEIAPVAYAPESCEAPEGYDDAITKDTEPAGTTGGNGKTEAARRELSANAIGASFPSSLESF